VKGRGLRAAFVLTFPLAACGDPVSHVYVGRRFDPARGCVDPASSIDVVDGKDPGVGCAAVCLTGAEFDGAAPPVYVSAMCPPYPHGFALDAGAGSCPAALLAFAQAVDCTADGGAADAGAHD
jgi:hypothetical protein